MTAGEARDRYADVGEAMRAAIARAQQADPRLGINDWRVLSAVFFFTASWSRLEDQATINQVAIVAFGADLDANGIASGWQRRRAAESLNALDRAGVITYRAEKGPRARIRIGLPARTPATPGPQWHPETRYDHEQSHPETGCYPDPGSYPDPGYHSIESHPETGSDSNGHDAEWYPDSAREVPGSRASGTPIQRESYPATAAHREVHRVLPPSSDTESEQSHPETGCYPDPGSHPDPGCDSTVGDFGALRALAAEAPWRRAELEERAS